MRQVPVRPLSAPAFATYGTYYDLGEGTGDVVRAEGDGWRDCRTGDPLLTDGGHLGRTLGTPLPANVAAMERHPHTREALFCAAAPVVLAVAAGAGDRPLGSAVEAFLIEPGDVVVLDEGIWHDACHGLTEPTYYYWHATELDGVANEWIALDGGPVTVEHR